MENVFINRVNTLSDYGLSEKAARALSTSNHERGGIEWKNLETDSPELYIYEQIGFDWMSGEGISALQFSEQLGQVSGKRITVRINSPGGDVFDGIAIYNQLVQHNGGVDVVIDGIAASAASIIAMAGDSIKMAETSQIMIHDAWTVAMGNEQVLREIAEVLEKIDAQIAGVYAARTGRRAATWREIMNQDSYFGPDEAVEAKLADEVLRSNKRRPKAEADPPAAEPIEKPKLAAPGLPLIQLKRRVISI